MACFEKRAGYDISVAVKESNLSYHNPDTMLFTIHPYYGNLN